MVENLFGSKTRYKLLKLFVSNPNRSFYVREITRQVGEQINSVRRELANLLSIGVITSDSSANRLYYEVNQKYDKYQALVGLLAEDKKKRKTAKVESDEKRLGNVSLVVLSGIFTRDRRAPADLLIVGNVSPSGLEAYLGKLESLIDSEVRYVVLRSDELSYRLTIKDKFLTDMLASKLSIKVDKDGLCK